MIKRLADALCTAFCYFSILPVRRATIAPSPDAPALIALPVVGAVIGGFAGLAAWLLSRIAPRPLVTATAFAVPIIVSGAIHIDGFLDCSDAIFATVPPSRRLEILKDPRHGTYAVTGLAIVSSFSLAALHSCRPSKLPAVLAFSGALARLAAVFNALWLSYAPGRTATRAFELRPSRAWLAIEAVILIFAALLMAPGLWMTVPAALIVSIAVARFISSRLGGGLVGDAYGFLIVAVEPGIIAVASALYRAE